MDCDHPAATWLEYKQQDTCMVIVHSPSTWNSRVTSFQRYPFTLSHGRFVTTIFVWWTDWRLVGRGVVVWEKYVTSSNVFILNPSPVTTLSAVIVIRTRLMNLNSLKPSLNVAGNSLPWLWLMKGSFLETDQKVPVIQRYLSQQTTQSWCHNTVFGVITQSLLHNTVLMP